MYQLAEARVRGGGVCWDGSTKYLHIVEYGAVSGVFQTIDPPTLSPPSECVLPMGGWGYMHSPGGEGLGGQYFGRRQTLDWPLIV